MARPLHEIANDILADPNFKGRAKQFATPHLRMLCHADTARDQVDGTYASTHIMYALGGMTTYKNRERKGELIDHWSNVHTK
jgi:hypothetical protein